MGKIDMATIRERLAQFAKEQGFKSLSGLEKACGFNKNTLTKGSEGMNSTTLKKIVEKFPQLSLDWVILGDGQMLDAEEETAQPTTETNELKSRLIEFARKQYDLGQNRFEEHCGIPRGTINNIKNGGGISTNTLTKIIVQCPELNTGWLLTGEGEMLNKQDSLKSVPDSHTLPLIPMEAFAGPGLPTYEDERIEDFYTVSEFKNSDFLIRVKGDSMTPKYSGGDLVACKKVKETYFLQWGRVYVIYTQSQGIMIKRVQPSEDDSYIKCVSDNPKYAPFDVPKEDIVSIALVNGAISLE